MQVKRLPSHWLTITPNQKINALIDALPAQYDEANKEYGRDVHTTHITSACLRQSYFSITSPKPTTAQEAKNFIVGEAQHVILQRLLGPLLNAKAEARMLTEIKNGKYVGIVSRVDLYQNGEYGNGPVEIKTNNSFKRAIKNYYLDQIRLYCAATKKRKAVLIIIWQNAAREIVDERLGTTKEAARAIESFDVKFTEQEMIDAKKNIENRYFELTNGLIKQDPSVITCVKGDDLLRRTTCGWCKYKQECDQADPVELRKFGQDGRNNARRAKRNET